MPISKSPDEWKKIVDQFKKKKQSKILFCKKQSVDYHQFLYWYKKLAHSNPFIPIKVEPSNKPLASIRIGLNKVIEITSMDVLKMILSGDF